MKTHFVDNTDHRDLFGLIVDGHCYFVSGFVADSAVEWIRKLAVVVKFGRPVAFQATADK